MHYYLCEIIYYVSIKNDRDIVDNIYLSYVVPPCREVDDITGRRFKARSGMSFRFNIHFFQNAVTDFS